MGSEVTIEGTINQKVNFIFDHMIVADFTQALLNRFRGVAGGCEVCGLIMET